MVNTMNTTHNDNGRVIVLNGRAVPMAAWEAWQTALRAANLLSSVSLATGSADADAAAAAASALAIRLGNDLLGLGGAQ